MVTIDENKPVVTLINVHICQPENQEELSDLLIEGINRIYKNAPGFISATVHKSFDGKHVTNYAQYESQEAVNAVWDNAEIPNFAKKVGKLADSFDPHLCEVVQSITPDK